MKKEAHWYDRSSTTHPEGLTRGRDFKYGADSGYQALYMLDRNILTDSNWDFYFDRLLTEHRMNLNNPTLFVGINDGQEIAPIVPKKGTVFGVDISLSALELGKKKYGDKIEFVNASAAALPFGDRSFDNIVSLRAYQVLKDEEKDQFLTNSKRILKPGGKIVISIANCFYDVDRKEVVSGYHVPDPITGKDVVEESAIGKDVLDLGRLLQRHGFRNIKLVPSPSEVFVFGNIGPDTSKVAQPNVL
jgi:SAM-dependent methyltransferase